MPPFPRLLAPLVFLALLLASVAHAHDGNPDNKLVTSEPHGDWEIWCIDYGGTGDIRCNLNLVIVYKPRPDFRAMIPRIYVKDEGFRMEIDKEWQTSFDRGQLVFADATAVSLVNCGSPCKVNTEKPGVLFELLQTSSSARIRFHDYVVQEFDLDFSLDGLETGLRRLRELHLEFSS